MVTIATILFFLERADAELNLSVVSTPPSLQSTPCKQCAALSRNYFAINSLNVVPQLITGAVSVWGRGGGVRNERVLRKCEGRCIRKLVAFGL